MADSFLKKENSKKKLQKQKDKHLRREERKLSNNKGKDLEDMFVYVDAYGNLTTTKPDPSEKIEINLNEIQIGAAPITEEDVVKTGLVTFVSEKGYGFITEKNTGDSIFFHNNDCPVALKKGNSVSFEKEKSPRGYVATNIQLVK